MVRSENVCPPEDRSVAVAASGVVPIKTAVLPPAAQFAVRNVTEIAHFTDCVLGVLNASIIAECEMVLSRICSPGIARRHGDLFCFRQYKDQLCTCLRW